VTAAAASLAAAAGLLAGWFGHKLHAAGVRRLERRNRREQERAVRRLGYARRP
jgi:hypothetical protein